MLCATFLGAISGANAQTKLNINGKTVSTAAKKIGGKTYVSIDDVAKALGMKASVAGGTISIRPAGGARQVANKLVGKQGEELFSGKVGFRVASVERAATYKSRFRNRYNFKEDYRAEEGSELVIVNCRLRNTTNSPVKYAFATGEWAENTALADVDAQSFAITATDVFAEESAPLGKTVLPAASLNFALIFEVPQGTKLKDLIYSVVVYNERGNKKGTHFRVGLN